MRYAPHGTYWCWDYGETGNQQLTEVSAYSTSEVEKQKYYQLYTTTEVKDAQVPPGSHYHRIDLRGEK